MTNPMKLIFAIVFISSNALARTDASAPIEGLRKELISVRDANDLIMSNQISLNNVMRLPENSFRPYLQGEKNPQMKTADLGVIIVCGVVVCVLYGIGKGMIEADRHPERFGKGGGGA